MFSRVDCLSNLFSELHASQVPTPKRVSPHRYALADHFRHQRAIEVRKWPRYVQQPYSKKRLIILSRTLASQQNYVHSFKEFSLRQPLSVLERLLQICVSADRLNSMPRVEPHLPQRSLEQTPQDVKQGLGSQTHIM